MANIPETLQNFRVYNNGGDLLGIADVQLPKLDSMVQTVKGAGIAGEVEAPVAGHYSAMDVELTWRTIVGNLVALAENKGIMLDIRGAGQGYDAESGEVKTTKIKVIVRGRPKGLDLGKLDAGAATDSKNTLACDYIKMDIDGTNKVEVDKFNYICKINGTDYLADVRDALGL